MRFGKCGGGSLDNFWGEVKQVGGEGFCNFYDKCTGEVVGEILEVRGWRWKIWR